MSSSGRAGGETANWLSSQVCRDGQVYQQCIANDETKRGARENAAKKALSFLGVDLSTLK